MLSVLQHFEAYVSSIPQPVTVDRSQPLIYQISITPINDYCAGLSYPKQYRNLLQRGSQQYCGRCPFTYGLG